MAPLKTKDRFVWQPFTSEHCNCWMSV